MSERSLSAKSVAIDLLSTMPSRHPVPVGALLRAASVFGIGENSMRVALARLRARGLVESDERGHYRLAEAAQPVNRAVRSWRAIEESVGPWDGAFVAVETNAVAKGDRKAARVRARALRLLGFEPLTASLRIRPDNLVGGVDAVRARLDALGFAPSPLVFRLSRLDADADRRARSLWDARALEASYAKLRASLDASAERLPTMPTAAAMAESFTLGGDVVRRIVLDPLLPDPIVDVAARRALVDAMRRYDKIGRACWKAWAGESVEMERSPADVGGLAPAVGTA